MLCSLQDSETIILNNKECHKALDELGNFIIFLDNFSESFVGKPAAVSIPLFDCSKMIESTKCTLSNVADCVKKYCLADAMTLLRKFKDDLFFVLYILSSYKEWLNKDKESQIVNNATKWFDNRLKHLNTCKVIETIFKVDEISRLDKELGIQDSFSEMAKQLNNYVHYNGIVYSNEIIASSKHIDVDKIFAIKENAKKIIVYFLVIIAIGFPCYLAASDYFDYLDIGITPPRGSQYWVAPFINSFLEKYSDDVDDKIKDCLKNMSCMDFSAI